MSTDIQPAPEKVPSHPVYEVGYLLSPLIAAEAVTETIDQTLKQAITTAGGTIAFEVAPKLTPLAYLVSRSENNKRTKYREAYFGALYFQAESEMIAAIQEALKGNNLVIRSLIMKTTTDAFRAPVRRPELRRQSPTEGGVKTELSSEEIDKEIEGLLRPATA